MKEKENELRIMMAIIVGLLLGLGLGFVLNSEISEILDSHKMQNKPTELKIDTDKLLLEDEMLITERMWKDVHRRIRELEFRNMTDEEKAKYNAFYSSMDMDEKDEK